MRILGPAAALLATVSLCVATVAGALGGHGSYPPQGAPPPPSPAELQKLERLAVRAAASAGDAHPTGGVVVPTTRRIAETVSAGDDNEASTPAYFVVIQGDFDMPEGPRPATPRAKPRIATVMTLTVDSRTNESTDGGLEWQVPNLYEIGEPEPLPLPA